MKIRYMPNKELRGINCDFPYKFVLDWSRAQEKFVSELDLSPYQDTPMYRERANLREEIPYDRKNLLMEDAEVILYGDRIEVRGKEDFIFPLEETSAVTVLGRNKLNIYQEGRIFQLKGDKRFCALKFVHIYHRYQNVKKGETHDSFLGI